MSRRLLLVVLVLVAVVVVVNAPLVAYVRHESAIESSGVDSVAPVLGTRVDGDSLVVRYGPPEGATGPAREATVDQATFGQAEDERVIPVRYPEGDPTDVVVTGATESPEAPWWVLWVDAALLLVAAVAAVLMRSRVSGWAGRYTGSQDDVRAGSA